MIIRTRKKTFWWSGCTAAWMPKGAKNAEFATRDITGFGYNLTYTNYSAALWNQAKGFGGSNGNYFITGIIPQQNQTLMVAYTEINDLTAPEFMTIMGMRENISGTNRDHWMRPFNTAATGIAVRYQNVQANFEVFHAAAVIAVNRYGRYVNGVRISEWVTNNNYLFTQKIALMGLYNYDAGWIANTMQHGFLAAACITNGHEEPETIIARSQELMSLIGL